MNIGSTFIANSKSAELGPPSVGSFNHPPVSPKAIFGFDPSTRNPRLDTFNERLALDPAGS